MNPYEINTESALDEEIITAVARELIKGELEYDLGRGDLVGVTYFDEANRLYYAADLKACKRYIDVFQRLDVHGGPNTYSIWCSETSAHGYPSRIEARENEGWN